MDELVAVRRLRRLSCPGAQLGAERQPEIALEALIDLGAGEIREILSRRIGEGGINVRVGPGEALPFLLVFTESVPSGGELTYSLDASSRLPSVDPP